MKSHPDTVALLIPHFNQREALELSLRSVTFAEPLVIVVVDDGSIEDHVPEPAWLVSLCNPFPVHLIRLTKNSGITTALNEGLDFILRETECRYIARLDCGDRNVNDRLNRQYSFMNQNPQIALCGAWCDVVSENHHHLYTLRPPVTHAEIKVKMLSGNCFVHPSVMFRSLAAREIGLYPGLYPAAEDYAYFFKFVHRYETTNLPEVLIQKIRTSESISYRRRREQLLSRLKIILANFRPHVQSLKGILQAVLFLVLPVSLVERLKESKSR